MTQKFDSLLRSAGLKLPSGFPNPLIESITCDSRLCQKGSLFLGLSGEKVDGGRFWPQAFSSGAVAAMIGSEAAKYVPPSSTDAVMVLSEPVGKWAGELAAAFWEHPSSKIALIGVTGTNGKTTTTHLIDYLCSAIDMPSALFGTLHNRWPNHSAPAVHTTSFADSLQAQLAEAVKAGATIGAMEVSSHALAQNRVAGCRFVGAIFTNLTQDHLDYHNSMEEYFQAKSCLFESPLLDLSQVKAKAVVNIDDVWGKRLAEQLGDRCWRSSLLCSSSDSGSAELTITQIQRTPLGTQGLLKSPCGEGRFESSLIGSFNLMNLLQAVGILIQQGFPLPELLERITGFPGVPGRMERVGVMNLSSRAPELPTVLVDYAHTPDGLKNALLASKSFSIGNLICVFGCGGDRDRGKRPQMGAIATELADRLILTSDNPRTEDPQQILNDVLAGMSKAKEIIVEADRSLAIQRAILGASSKDVILIAGKGHETYQLIGANKIHFDDREEAKKALRQRSMNS